MARAVAGATYALLLASAALALVCCGTAIAASNREAFRTNFLEGRFLSQVSTETPTLDDVDSVIFSRPPNSAQDTSEIVYYVMAGVYVACAIILLVAVNLDTAERKRRVARAIVPEELVPHRLACCTVNIAQPSMPGEISEQYYLDSRLLSLRSAEEIGQRRRRMNFWGYAFENCRNFLETLKREHLLLSFFFHSIPTFTRVKRGVLLILHLHLCLLTSAVVLNIREHTYPLGSYMFLNCGSEGRCLTTLPWAALAAAIMCPAFRYIACRQMRLTCFVSQTHPSTSAFPLGVRKFASAAPRSTWDILCCVRNDYERRRARVARSRSIVHRMVEFMWRTTRPATHVLRFHGVAMSWCILTLTLAVWVVAAMYVFLFTAYLEDDIVYHWLAWTLTMHFGAAVVMEALLLFWMDVIWLAIVSEVAQYWGFGPHALAATTKYKEVVRQVETVFVGKLKEAGAVRIQRWWTAVLDMYRAISEQTAAAVKIQKLQKKAAAQKKYKQDRKWCLKVDVMDCWDLEQVIVADDPIMSPLVKLRCDVGNPNVMHTKVSWHSGTTAVFNETFWIDIKESNGLYVSAWSKGLVLEEFVGRGHIDLSELKSSEEHSHMIHVPLYPIQHGDKPRRDEKPHGFVNCRLQFMDPMKEECGHDGSLAWMLPANRVKFAMYKYGDGGRMSVGRSLRSFLRTPPNSSMDGHETFPRSSHEAAEGRPDSSGPGRTPSKGSRLGSKGRIGSKIFSTQRSRGFFSKRTMPLAHEEDASASVPWEVPHVVNEQWRPNIGPSSDAYDSLPGSAGQHQKPGHPSMVEDLVIHDDVMEEPHAALPIALAHGPAEHVAAARAARAQQKPPSPPPAPGSASSSRAPPPLLGSPARLGSSPHTSAPIRSFQGGHHRHAPLPPMPGMIAD